MFERELMSPSVATLLSIKRGIFSIVLTPIFGPVSLKYIVEFTERIDILMVAVERSTSVGKDMPGSRFASSVSVYNLPSKQILLCDFITTTKW